VDDVRELLRLRAVMMAAMDGEPPEPGSWQRLAEQTLAERMADGELAAFVVDGPDGTLAACAVATIERRLGGPANPTGRIGYIFNVATDPGWRRRGYSRACMLSLLDWLREQGVVKVELRATQEGEPLYRSLGFSTVDAPTLRMVLGSVQT
jgi:GNAT superfamily N-acetyltransferase